LHLISKFQ